MSTRARSLPTEPYDFRQASEADQEASDRQRAAEQWIIDSAKAAAEAERAYREALALKILALKAEGTAWTSCGDLARGDKEVAALKYKRDVAEGVREAAAQGAWRASKDRQGEATRIEWSMRRDLADAYRPPAGPADTQVIGGRRAA